jgi:phage tail-like protein
MAEERDNPYGNYNFTVEISGLDNPPHAGFSEVSGLDMEITPIEYRAGNDQSPTVRKLPGLAKFGNVTLKRGITGSLAMWEWMKRAHADPGSLARTVVIHLLDEARNEVMAWKLRNAWPARYAGPELDATSNEVAIESFELAHEGLEIE